MRNESDLRTQTAIRLPRDLLIAAEDLLESRRAALREDGWHWRAQCLTRSDILREALRIGLGNLRGQKTPTNRRQTAAR